MSSSSSSSHLQRGGRQRRQGQQQWLLAIGGILLIAVVLGQLVSLVAYHYYHLNDNNDNHHSPKKLAPPFPSSSQLKLQGHACSSSSIQQNFTSCCALSDDCIMETAERLARVWAPHRQFFSAPSSSTANRLSSKEKGNDCNVPSSPPHHLWLIKVPKSASSTMAGLVLRIADNHQKTRKNCSEATLKVTWEHGSALEQNVAKAHSVDKNHDNTFVLAPIRDPQARALSDIYYHRVSLRPQQKQQQQRNQQPADSFIVRGLNELPSNYITEYTRFVKDSSNDSSNNAMATVAHILQQYHFLFVVEDMTRSLVVFAWLTGLSLPHLILSSSKLSGSWYAVRGRCVALVPPRATPAIQELFGSAAWKRAHAADRLLHAAAQRSLIKTIHHIGTDRVERAVQRLQAVQADVDRHCAKETHFPCSANGTLQRELAQESCYQRDFGCGHQCQNRYLEQRRDALPSLFDD